VQLAIGHLPRVDQRLLAMMDLLAERWGEVTPAGVLIPLNLTHETIGGLIGASRPSMTIAVGGVVDAGALVLGDTGWLLGPHPRARSTKLEG